MRRLNAIAILRVGASLKKRRLIPPQFTGSTPDEFTDIGVFFKACLIMRLLESQRAMVGRQSLSRTKTNKTMMMRCGTGTKKNHNISESFKTWRWGSITNSERKPLIFALSFSGSRRSIVGIFCPMLRLGSTSKQYCSNSQ